MRIAIDASNIRQGGGLTHLTQLLANAQPARHDIERVCIWSAEHVLARLPNVPWLERQEHPWLEQSLPVRLAWQRYVMPAALRSAGIDLLFSPGGSVPRRCSVPFVAMSQNMLPFEPAEAATFGKFSPMRFKMRLLRRSQGNSMLRAAGVIFLSSYAQERLASELHLDGRRMTRIPHGIEPRFFRRPPVARPISECSAAQPFRLLYVSILMPYKHQIEVAQAVARLRAKGIPIVIDFVGAPWGWYGRAFERERQALDPGGLFLRWHGEIPFERLHLMYQESDGFVFASSCENLPNIVIEAMASGLPILCSDRGPMPEVLGADGCYFDPYSVDSIMEAMRNFVGDTSLRERLAAGASARAKQYSWQRCADQTFAFLSHVAGEWGGR